MIFLSKEIYAIFFSKSNNTPNYSSDQADLRKKQTYVRRPLPKNLSSEEYDVLHPPEKDASKEEKDTYYLLIQKLATPSSYLTLNKCEKPYPLIYKITSGTNILVKNTDTKPHIMQFDKNNSFSIPARSEKKIMLNFKYKNGYHGYACDNQFGVVGFIFLVQ